MSKILQIQLKGRGGPYALVCTRSDGTFTMQKDRTGFFPLHDLTHYAIESVLGHRRGFFGLVAEGWDLEDFGTPWPRGRIPEDAEPAENIAGLLDIERRNGQTLNAAEFTNALASEGIRVTLTEAQLSRIRACLRELEEHWDAVMPGQSLDLIFTVNA